jgi:poly(3-hydroxyalkanoate) synthetase
MVKQLVAEQLRSVKDRRGFARQEWAKLRERNEALDCALLARAALWLLGADRYGERFWARLRDEALAALLPALEPLMEATGTLPVDALQMLFVVLDPFGVAERYRGFGRLDPAAARVRRFVALEDWLNDGVPLAAPAARECPAGWYGANTPARGAWRIAGLPVDPAAWRGPAFLAIPAWDRIVPPGSAAALSEHLGGRVEVHCPATGYIGMAAGTGAEAALWQPLLRWIKAG